MSKCSLKKLILDTCQKTTVSFNNKLYEQIDGVNMCGSFGPVLANIIMTEWKKSNCSEVDEIESYVLC